MNKKGFTLIEVSIFIVVMGFVLFGILRVPIDLFGVFNLVDKTSDIYTDTMMVDESIKKDIFIKPNNYDEIQNMIKDQKTLDINGIIYEFENDGVYRINEKNRTKLTRDKLNYAIIEDNRKSILRIYNKDIELEYNLDYINYIDYNKGD